jgi:hypothetical protein
MTSSAAPSVVKYPMGTIGLALILAVTRLVELDVAGGTSVGTWTRRTIARVGLASVSLIGTCIDGLSGRRRGVQPAMSPTPAARL